MTQNNPETRGTSEAPRRPTLCSWCESDYALPSWGWLIIEGEDESYVFCHAGCLAHWLYANETAYFTELDVVPK